MTAFIRSDAMAVVPLAVNLVNSQTSVIGADYTKTPTGQASRITRMDMLYFNCRLCICSSDIPCSTPLVFMASAHSRFALYFSAQAHMAL